MAKTDTLLPTIRVLWHAAFVQARSAAEKGFNRADVFKRHLISVHGVE